MRKVILSTALMVLLCTPALASGPVSPVQQTVPSVAARLQTMQINEVLRMKVAKQKDFAGTGIKDMKPGDEVEVEKLAPDKIQVKHLPSGQTGIMPQPK